MNKSVLNLSSIEPLGFDGAVSVVRQRSELQNSANVFDSILLIATVYVKIEQSSISWVITVQQIGVRNKL